MAFSFFATLSNRKKGLSLLATLHVVTTKEQNVNRPDQYLHLKPDRGRVSSSIVAAIVALSLAVLSACSNGVTSIQNQDCAKQAHGTLPWGYYPGWGCGPVPRAQTVFS
jgi:hypothetical protein